MSTKKNALTPYKIFDGIVMSANRESIPTNINWLDNVGIVLSFTGTPQGHFEVQVSNDYQPAQMPNSVPVNAGTWITVPLDNIPVAGGVDDTVAIDLNQLPFQWVKVVYVRSSGTGTLNGQIVSKSV